MAVYKLIQDIEAEDKLIGPLTLKGFIYALIAGTLAFINVKIAIAGGPSLRFLAIFILALPMLLFGVLASPLGGEQPTEIWLLSRVLFMLKPRKRIWDLTGTTDKVNITAPPKVEKHLTKEFAPGEVQSRLKTLALTLDSQGWALQDSGQDEGSQYLPLAADDPERLVSTAALPQSVPPVDVQPHDDILDPAANPKAQAVDNQMVQRAAQQKAALQKRLDDVRKAPPAKPALPAEPASVVDDKGQITIRHRMTQPAQPPKPAVKAVTTGVPPARLELAQSGNDLKVATIAKLVNQPKVQQNSGEVVIELH